MSAPEKVPPQFICLTCKTVIGEVWDDHENQCKCKGDYSYEVCRMVDATIIDEKDAEIERLDKRIAELETKLGFVRKNSNKQIHGLEEKLKQTESDRDWYKQSFEDDMTLKLVQAVEFINQHVPCICTAQMLQDNNRDCLVCKLLSKLECKEKK